MDQVMETAKPTAANPVVKARMLSHGTMEVKDMAAARRFYTEFLGLDCFRHNKPAMMVSKGGDWVIVCVQVGAAAHPLNVLNHWGIDVDTREEVDAAHRAATEMKDTYGMKKITTPGDQHGTYSFYIEDLDHNWWEIQFFDGIQHEDMFDFGDRFTDADLPDAFK